MKGMETQSIASDSIESWSLRSMSMIIFIIVFLKRLQFPIPNVGTNKKSIPWNNNLQRQDSARKTKPVQLCFLTALPSTLPPQAEN